MRIKISDEDVHEVYGLPKGKRVVDLSEKTEEEINEMVASLGLKCDKVGTTNVDLEVLRDRLYEREVEINDSGGENDQPMGSGTKEDESINGSDELRTTVPVDALDLSALETTLEAEQEEDASKLWNSIVEEASNI
ncbi:hypothetical protein LINPERHAP2_LOCUS5544 [Linum perenne]